jgi:predicted RNase H-like nuclease (RuvC/YqgF family)
MPSVATQTDFADMCKKNIVMCDASTQTDDEICKWKPFMESFDYTKIINQYQRDQIKHPNKKIDDQNKIIDSLKRENEYLRDQIKHLNKKIDDQNKKIDFLIENLNKKIE